MGQRHVAYQNGAKQQKISKREIETSENQLFAGSAWQRLAA